MQRSDQPLGDGASRGDCESGEECFPEAPLDLEPCKLREWLDTHKRWALGLDDATSGEEIESLYQTHVGSPCPVEEVLGEIAAHRNTPVKILTELGHQRWRKVHLDLSLNPNVPVSILRQMARSRRFAVLEHVAWHPNTPLDALERLARHPRARAAREVAQRRLHERAEGHRRSQGDQGVARCGRAT